MSATTTSTASLIAASVLAWAAPERRAVAVAGESHGLGTWDAKTNTLHETMISPTADGKSHTARAETKLIDKDNTP